MEPLTQDVAEQECPLLWYGSIFVSQTFSININCKFYQDDECKHKYVIELTPELKTLLLSEHNSWRNALAAGRIKNFPSASRMMKMVTIITFILIALLINVWYVCLFHKIALGRRIGPFSRETRQTLCLWGEWRPLSFVFEETLYDLCTFCSMTSVEQLISIRWLDRI